MRYAHLAPEHQADAVERLVTNPAPGPAADKTDTPTDTRSQKVHPALTTKVA
jgi:hypothetical protein